MEIRATEQWRKERIEKLLRVTSSMLGMDEEQLKALIHAIDDHQGTLHVNWRHLMTPFQCHAFGTAWALCGEHKGRVEHHVGL